MIEYKRNEDRIIAGIKAYVDATYSAHYSGSAGRDVCDDWEDMGIAKEAYMSNIVKYVKRFGKKEGENPKDIMKIIHYCVFLLNELDKEKDWDDKFMKDHEVTFNVND